MSRIAHRLREAREAAGFTPEAMARLVNIEPAAVTELESGVLIPRPAVLRRYATVFGTRVRGLLERGAARSPATLLFRSAAEHGTDLSEELRAADLRLLGEFLACVADVDELERLLGLPEASSIAVDAPDLTLRSWEQGRECARRVREQLGLGDEPIPSMLTLLEDRLHWSPFFVTPDELSAAIQGASTIAPKPAILVNLVGGRESWWRTRVSLAHELCHVVFDARARSQPYLLTPEGELEARNRWALVERFRSIEQRANAFAVHFLAPSDGLRRVVGRAAADAEEAINEVCTTFGIGRMVAIRRLGHEYELSEPIQERMLARGGTVAHASEHADAAIVPGLRTGRLQRLVCEALQTGKIDAVEAHSILNIPMTQVIEGSGEPPPSAVRLEGLAAARAEAYEWEINRTRCISTRVDRTGEGWDVVVECGRGATSTRKIVRLSPQFEPVSRT